MRKAALYALSSTVALFCALTLLPISGFKAAYFANQDFIQYWSALQALISGQNPYDPAVLFPLQQQLGKIQEPMMNWNPPWALALLSPILMMSFETSAIAFLIMQVILALLAVLILAQCFQSYRHSTGAYCLLITICFPPLWHSLARGQLGAVLLFGVSLVIWGAKFGKLWPMAFGLAVLSIKFHLFFIFVLSLVAYLGLKISFALCLRTGALVACLAAYAQLINSSSIEFWIKSLAFNQSFNGAVHARNWIGATFYGFIRAFRNIYLPESPDWIPALIIILSLAAASSYLFLACRKNSWEALVTSLSYSIFLAPLGWFFDFCVLIPYALVLAFRKKCSDMGAIVIILYNAIILLAYLASEMHVQLFWVPLGFIIIDRFFSGFLQGSFRTANIREFDSN